MTHNGNQELVLAAANGRNREEIAEVTGLDIQAVTNALRRLVDRGDITPEGQRRHRRYRATDRKPMLAEVW